MTGVCAIALQARAMSSTKKSRLVASQLTLSFGSRGNVCVEG